MADTLTATSRALTNPDIVAIIIAHLLPPTAPVEQSRISRLARVHSTWVHPAAAALSRHPIVTSGEDLLALEEFLRRLPGPATIPDAGPARAPARTRAADGVAAAKLLRTLDVDFSRPKRGAAPGDAPLRSRQYAPVAAVKDLYVSPALAGSLCSLRSLCLCHLKIQLASLIYLLESVAGSLEALALHDVTPSGGGAAAAAHPPASSACAPLYEAVLSLPRLRSLQLTGLLASRAFFRSLSRRVSLPAPPAPGPAPAPPLPVLPLEHLGLIECRCPVAHAHWGSFVKPFDLVAGWIPDLLIDKGDGTVMRAFGSESLSRYPEWHPDRHRLKTLSLRPGETLEWVIWAGWLERAEARTGIRTQVTFR